MKKLLSLTFFLLVLQAVQAQYGGVYISPRFGYSMGYRPHRNPYNAWRDSTFKPSLNISIGYGFPNLDKYQFAQTYQYYNQPYTAIGPVMGSVDYRFSRATAIGLLITSGSSKADYYDYNSSGNQPSFTGTLNSTAIMLDLVNYMPVNNPKVTPYLRTALGVNVWNERYTDGSGNKMNFSSNPSDFAYQISLGSNFYIADHFGFFVEAGYGKYILNAGLSLKF